MGWVILGIVVLGLSLGFLEGKYGKWWRSESLRVLTQPDDWPKKRIYNRNVKFTESLGWLPTRLGTGDMVILNMPGGPFAPFLLISMPLAALLWLLIALPYHWIWYRFAGK